MIDNINECVHRIMELREELDSKNAGDCWDLYATHLPQFLANLNDPCFAVLEIVADLRMVFL